LEGKRVEPRLKPPYPTVSGFLGCPTLINNPETFYAVSLIDKGIYENKRFYSLSGAGVEPGVKELPLDITVKKMLEEFGHQPSEKYFYLVGGGAAGTCYSFKQLNRKFDSVASVVIYNIDEPEEEVIMNWLEFFENESCGQCVPCREGTYRLRNLMRNKFVNGVAPDQAVLDDLIFTMQTSSFCALGKVSTTAFISYQKNIKGIK
jgi:[NiFe] hydrogenase diaphorase moiety large subunit